MYLFIKKIKYIRKLLTKIRFYGNVIRIQRICYERQRS